MHTKRNTKITNDNCSICFANKKEYAFNKCGHLCICKQCKYKMTKSYSAENNQYICPICRTKGNIIKIYL